MSIKSEHVKRWRAKSKARIIESFGGSCGVCGYNKCPDALELHHLIPSEKEFTLGSIRATPKNWDYVVTELRKCVMLCSICHREFHYGIITDLSNCSRFDEHFSDYKNNQRLDKMDSCPICGELKHNSKNTCSNNCAGIIREKIKWPSEEELAKLVWVIPTTTIAKQLGVSDKAVEKRLKKFNLPKPPRGYWAKNAPPVGFEPT